MRASGSAIHLAARRRRGVYQQAELYRLRGQSRKLKRRIERRISSDVAAARASVVAVGAGGTRS